MPKKDGFEVVEILKADERTNHIPIIMLTARATQQDRLIGLKHGADAYLTKPFDQEELFIRLDRLLTLRRLLQERYTNQSKTVSVIEADIIEPEAPFIQKIRSHIEADLMVNLTIEELAAKMNLTRVQVFRKVKALSGQSPTQLINLIRLEHGAKLLLTTSMTISEIAYDIGYSDPKYFSRVFTKSYGKSPTNYREVS
jgi:YesN/AraC family two-component response regulator